MEVQLRRETRSGGRRSQAERSETTRMALLETTIDLLHENGYTRLTTQDVAERAQVSRGALTHHFAHKEDLVVAAISWQLSEATSALEDFASRIELLPIDTDRIVDYLWQMMAKRLFHVTLEYLPEARNNQAFRLRLIPVVATFHAALDRIWEHLARSTSLTPQQARTILNATMCLMRGMVAQQVLRQDEDYFDDLLHYWRALFRREIAAARGAPP
ncbi:MULTISPECIES: TetR/AcrR family transcriptional regulator [Nguyenibacter]|uniref:Helix-turn-helix domain-containing protein n=1 Tax=Nguyenibacter vanlangensis TaxID=1216886 RepID=A0A7Y7IU12_9PROT|nr:MULTISPECIES: TetR/AcrR family transcriptional regulator [Nguyenibacter]NVN10324.1 TetR/AcrR family transcriptional regulator [Nguyenibacter vanlangensis]WRH87183.1 helix-turn-helix domain-containing protein [Nguyenibacter sp. L1]